MNIYFWIIVLLLGIIAILWRQLRKWARWKRRIEAHVAALEAWIAKNCGGSTPDDVGAPPAAPDWPDGDGNGW